MLVSLAARQFFSICIVGVSRFSVGFSFWNDPVLDPRTRPALFFRSGRWFCARNKHNVRPPARGFKVTRPSRNRLSALCFTFLRKLQDAIWTSYVPIQTAIWRNRIDESCEINVIRYNQFHNRKHSFSRKIKKYLYFVTTFYINQVYKVCNLEISRDMLT